MTQILKITGCIALISIAAGLFFGRGRKLDAAAVARGKTLFEHEWTVDDPLCAEGDGLGPVFNAKSCVACHFQGGVGGSGPRSSTVSTFQMIDRERPEQLISGVVHKDATEKEAKETGRDVHEQFIDDIGTRSRQLQTIGGCNVSVTRVNPVVFHECRFAPLVWHRRNRIHFGLEFVSNERQTNRGSRSRQIFVVSSNAMGKALPTCCPTDGSESSVGKGQFATAEEFIATACAMELGPDQSESPPTAGRSIRTRHRCQTRHDSATTR